MLPNAIAAKSATPVSPIDIPPLDASVHTLSNGLEIIVREDHEHPLVSVQFWIRAGSIHEENWTGAGLAHCVEHMLFKGTAKRSAEDITRNIQERGGYVNAYTSFNRTVYWIDGLADQAAEYIDILGDMVRHPQIDEAELAREKEVIRREMAMDHDDPDATLHHLMQSTAFRRHPLKHPIIGHRAIFDELGGEDVAAFISRHYIPNNCFIVIVGAVKTKEILTAAKRLLEGWERRRYEPVLLPTEPPLTGRRQEFRPFSTELSRVSLGWQVPGEAHPDKAALDVIAFLLGSGRSSRLYQELREKQGIAHDVWAGAWCAQECGLFQIEAECDPSDTAKAEPALAEVVQTLQRDGPSEEELSKAMRATLNGQLRSLSTTKGQAASLGQSWLISGSLALSLHYLQSVRALTPERVRDVARLYFQLDNLCVVQVGPQPKAKRTTSHKQRSNDGEPQRFDLDGFTLLVQENKRLPLVSIRAQFLAGVLSESDTEAGVSMASSQLLLKGTTGRKASAIQSELENLGGSLHCTADAHRRLLGADIMRGDEGQALDLLADLALHPLLPEKGLAEVKKRQIASILEEQEDPLTVGLRRARAEIFGGRPFARTALGTLTSIRHLKTDVCRKSLQQSFRRQNGVITVFGDVDAEAVRDQVAAAFHHLPAGKKPFDPKKALPSRTKPGRWDERLAKEQAVLVIGFRTVPLHHADTPVLNLIDEACSDMGSRLFNRIREELGLAYYVGAQAFSALSCGAFYFYLGTDPSRLDEAQEEMMRLIADLAKAGLDKGELERSKTTWKSSWLRAQQGNPAMADLTGWHELCGLGHQHFQQLPKQMAAISVEETHRVASDYLQPNRAFLVRVSPGGN